MFRTLTSATALALLSPAASAQQNDAAELGSVVVNGTRSANLVGAADSATEGTITAKQLATRPLLRAAEVLESVPGLTVTQHSGDGKANQYFLRGFNLDHGTDFATYIDGMPVNNTSHAHGQGYADLNFLIPEIVRAVRYHKGSYAAEDGDLGVTGVARIDLQNSLPERFVDATLGAHAYRRLLAAGSTDLGAGRTLLGAAEAGATDGPWEQPERLRKTSVVLRLASGTASDGYSITAMAYRSKWTATEHVPLRAVEGGEIGRYGTLAPSDGGITFRNSLSASWAGSGEDRSTRASAYLIGYGLNLFSTPSGLQEPQHEQEDRRTVAGGAISHTRALDAGWLGAQASDASVGLQARLDRLPRQGLFQTLDRVRTASVREDRVQQQVLSAFGQARSTWSPWLRSTLGLRFDHLGGSVTSLGGAFNGANGGRASGSLFSPKLALAFGPFDGTEFYANAGTGFHSNDLRGATSTVNPADGSAVDRVPVLAKARSSELGLRTSPLAGWNLAFSLWQTALSSELVFIGDAGVTEPKGASRRSGIELWNDLALKRWLTLDADLAVSRARFTQAVGGGNHVPNAIPVNASMGLSADNGGPWFAGLRVRYVGAYPLEETGTRKSTPFATVNLKLGWRASAAWRISLDVLNLFDRKANDIEYWGTACTRAEGPACNGGEGYDGKSVHPLEPRTLRFSLRAGF